MRDIYIPPEPDAASPAQRLAMALDEAVHGLGSAWRRWRLRRAIDREPGDRDLVGTFLDQARERDAEPDPDGRRGLMQRLFARYVMTGEIDADALAALAAIARPPADRDEPLFAPLAPVLTRAERVLLDGAMDQVAAELLAERRRQISAEGWTTKHDERHTAAELARAGAAYAWAASRLWPDWIAPAARLWPWEPESFKPKDPRRDLVRAGALVIAAIERMDREAVMAADVEAS